jgi:allantoin racemase
MNRPRLLIVNPNASVQVTRWLKDEAERVAQSRFEVAAVNAPSGLAAIETPNDLLRAMEAVVSTIAEDNAATAAAIGAFGDPGLAEARALVRIPVFGLGEEGLRAAGATGPRFSIVTLGEAMRAPIAVRVQAFGLGAQLQHIHVLPMSVADMIANRDAYRWAVAKAIRASSPSAVLLGGAPFAGLGAPMAEETGAVVLDGVEAVVEAAAASLCGPRQ